MPLSCMKEHKTFVLHADVLIISKYSVKVLAADVESFTLWLCAKKVCEF